MHGKTCQATFMVRLTFLIELVSRLHLNLLCSSSRRKGLCQYEQYVQVLILVDARPINQDHDSWLLALRHVEEKISPENPELKSNIETLKVCALSRTTKRSNVWRDQKMVITDNSTKSETQGAGY
jgi:hypothetical protein